MHDIGVRETITFLGLTFNIETLKMCSHFRSFHKNGVDKRIFFCIIKAQFHNPYQEWRRDRPCEARQPACLQGAKSGGV